MNVHIGDLTMYYEETGSGIPVLCLPPFPFDHRIWRGQRALGDVARLIMPDLRGTGKSSLTDGPATMELLAGDMLALLNHLHLERAVVMGVSMGVYIAFALAASHAERLCGLVLADSRAQADSPETAERRRQTVANLRREGTAMLHDRVNDLFAGSTHGDQPELVAAMQQEAREENPEGLALITLGMALRPDRLALLPHIALPTLVLCGEEDRVSPPEGMREMAALIPGAHFHLIPRAGHLSPLEQPDAFNQAVRAFLQNVEELRN